MPVEYDELPRTDANYVALTPVSFLHRAADIYPQREAVLHGDRRFTWAQTRERCVRVASALAQRGIGRNDTVAIFAFNTPEMIESHFSAPMAGAVLNAINIRLDAATVAYVLDHGEARMVLCDRQLWPVMQAALAQAKVAPQLIIIDDPAASQRPELPEAGAYHTYEQLVDMGDPAYQPPAITDEWQALALNYTSGTTGLPKGVVYHHRGSYLMTMGTAISWTLPAHPRYVYTVPLFHCNGWGHVWTMAAVAGTLICIREFTPERLFDLLDRHDGTHFGGAPIVLAMLANAPESARKTFQRSIQVMTAGAPPPASVLAHMRQFGFEVMHVYGLTETYGHILQSAPQDWWRDEPPARQAELKARQGVRFAMTEAVDVLDAQTGQPAPHDGETLGEIVIRGNTVMKGYLKDAEATAAAFKAGWFHSGDLAVVDADGYIRVKDRAKDIIISGGENISSVEVENVLFKHPAVGLAAVVALADAQWGEAPCAFVELKPGAEASAQQLIDFCAENMARFKRPKRVIFGELPKTATGKIQKHVLRDRAKQLGAERQ